MSMLLGTLLAVGAAVVPPVVDTAPPVAVVAKPALRPSPDQVMAAVRAEWPKYDQGGKGRLTPLEFSIWVMQSHGATVAPRAHAGGIAPVSAMNASATAFARADLNHDGGVTPDEMARFLMAPPAPTALPKAKAVAKPAPAIAMPAGTAIGN
jgi:hypothetical protein